jgi:hypothetical protein
MLLSKGIDNFPIRSISFIQLKRKEVSKYGTFKM